MSTRAAFITFICLLPFALKAQKINLINSTERRWSGGIAGRSGANYTFSIEFTGFKKEPVPDTLWIGNDPVIILMQGSNSGGYNTTLTRKKETLRYDISAGTQRDEYEERYPHPPGEGVKQKSRAPISYSGIALLSYTYKGNRKYFVITRIMKTYPPVSYP